MIATALLLIAAAVAPQDAAVPRAIRTYVARRQRCTHWGDEEPYDTTRAREIARALRQERCDRLDADERALRRRYHGRSTLLRLIDAAERE
jgi:hypothetical protein